MSLADNKTTQHGTTQVQHKTARVQQAIKQVQNNIQFILINLCHRCKLGPWYISL